MTEDEQGRQKKRRRLWLALAVVVAVLAVLIVPPFLSISRYKSRITGLIASSLGRPVRLSSVSLRLLPRPGFVLDDLTVEEDPEFGAEPLLHASTVTASIRLLSLWRGQLEISEISVDEASLNLVRKDDGRWNLDSLFRTAAAKTGPAAQASGEREKPFPYLAATNSRVNVKNGVEKLPFSLVNTDLSFWQEDPSEWRIRLRGQPARTDVSMDLGDTGIVELNASAKRAPELRLMPIHLDMEWRDAQLGQLTRLATGSDAGWRGDLRGEVHVDGTAADAQVNTRLRATNVHRAEFAPVAPMDFDANCGFVYHYADRSLEKLVCDSPLGAGHVRLAGELPGNGVGAQFSVELDRVPAGAGLDALRTVRSGVDPGLEAAGTVSGKISYAEVAAGGGAPKKLVATGRARTAKAAAPVGPLTGTFTLDGFALSGAGITKAIEAPKLVLSPAVGRPATLTGTVAIPMGGTTPLTVNVLLGPKGYQVSMRGQTGIAEGRELARASGVKESSALDALAGDPLAVELNAAGPWMPAEEIWSSNIQQTTAASDGTTGGTTEAAKAMKKTPVKPGAKASAEDVTIPATDSLSGTVTVHNANWRADYLVNHVEIADATLHVQLAGGVGASIWDPIDFSYGPLQGKARLTAPAGCTTPESCQARLELTFGELDAATVQTAILGAREKGTLLSDLINRLHPSSAPVWPELECTVNASSLILEPVTLTDVTLDLHFLPTGADTASLDGKVLGGTVHGIGSLSTGDKPGYTLAADFAKLDPAEVGKLVGASWRGGTLDAQGKIGLSGYTGSDLADSANGTLHFEWKHGSVSGGGVPQPLARFERWTGDAQIANDKVTLGQNEVVADGHTKSVDAGVTLAEPPKLSFAAPKLVQLKKPESTHR